MAEHALSAEQFDDGVQQRTAATLGMWVFLATEVLFFGVLFAAYLMLRLRFGAAFAEASRRTDMLAGTLDTAILLTSSFTLVLALRAIEAGSRRSAVRLLVATALLGAAFLGLHGMEYHKEYTEHLIPGLDFVYAGERAGGVEIFFCLYYLITGFHSLHVLIGVVLLAVMAWRCALGAFGPLRSTPVEIAALYWHFVDIVWVFVYPALYLVSRS
ncbi:MAG TPA: cytochrome c oxidase subunit 3 [Rudaea sp.]|nr:cytochrome c oxidase subunit 3 [Rudaea sp.]